MSKHPTKDMSIALAKHPEKAIWLGFRTILLATGRTGLALDFFGARDDLALTYFTPLQTFASGEEARPYGQGILDHYAANGCVPDISGDLSTWPRPVAACCAAA